MLRETTRKSVAEKGKGLRGGVSYFVQQQQRSRSSNSSRWDVGQVTLPLTAPVYALLLRSSEVRLVTHPRAEGMGTGWPLI